jgi:hypothetical protein
MSLKELPQTPCQSVVAHPSRQDHRHGNTVLVPGLRLKFGWQFSFQREKMVEMHLIKLPVGS